MWKPPAYKLVGTLAKLMFVFFSAFVVVPLVPTLLWILWIEPTYFPQRYAAEKAVIEAKEKADHAAIEAKRQADQAAAAPRARLDELNKDLNRKYAPRWALVAILRDPDAAKFGTVYVFPDEDGEHACGGVNAKNGFGGYDGMKRFMAGPSSAVLDDGSQSFQSLWSSKCLDTSNAIEVMY